jgi:hypothetical protein
MAGLAGGQFNDDDLCNAYPILFSGFLIYCSGISEYFWIL